MHKKDEMFAKDIMATVAVLPALETTLKIRKNIYHFPGCIILMNNQSPL